MMRKSRLINVFSALGDADDSCKKAVCERAPFWRTDEFLIKSLMNASRQDKQTRSEVKLLTDVCVCVCDTNKSILHMRIR